MLEPVKTKYGDALSWADLIVYAGQVAIESSTAASGSTVALTGGRTDATDGSGSEYLNAWYGYNGTIAQIHEFAKISVLTEMEVVALGARPRSAVLMGLQGYGVYTTDPKQLSKEYFSLLLGGVNGGQWQPVTVDGVTQYKLQGEEVYVTNSDLNVVYQQSLANYAEQLAADDALFTATFYSAWSKLMDADLFFAH